MLNMKLARVPEGELPPENLGDWDPPQVLLETQEQTPGSQSARSPKENPATPPQKTTSSHQRQSLEPKEQTLPRSHVKSECSKCRKSGAWNPRGDPPNPEQVATCRGMSISYPCGCLPQPTSCHLSRFAVFGPNFFLLTLKTVII